MATIAEAMNLAVQLHQAGNLNQAEVIYQQVLQADSRHAQALHMLGVIAHQRGKSAEAIALIGKALALRPHDAALHANLGTVLQECGRTDEAVAHYREALRLRPDYPEAHNNLGNALRAQGKLVDAVFHYQQAIQLWPNYDQAHNNLGTVLQLLEQWPDAERHCREALRLRPNWPQAHADLANLLQHQGKTELAKAHFQESYRLVPNDRIRLQLATTLPVVYESVDHICATREKLCHDICRLQEERFQLDLTDTIILPPFFLAYQGMNDRDIHRDLAGLCAAPACEPGSTGKPRRLRPGKKIRIGFVSRFFKDHTVGRLMQGLIANLSRKLFHVSLISIGDPDDAVARAIRRTVDNYVPASTQVSAVRQAIAAQNFDILYYPDIGIEPITYNLAHWRLAPIQCVTWGHPVTTGMSSVDYFISSDLFESHEADGHYTEKLVRMKTLTTFFYRPVLHGRRLDRSHFGLKDSEHVYACPQSSFKLHPDFDEVLGGILRADSAGVAVLLCGKHAHWDELLRSRFSTTIPDVLTRIRFVPQQDRLGYLNLLNVADVLLDPLHFGGGHSSLEGLALGTPIVTLPSAFLRGRLTWGMYQKMNVLDCVASTPQEYVEIAVKLGTDSAYRAHVRSRILAASDALFVDMEAVRELEQFFLSAITKAYSEPKV